MADDYSLPDEVLTREKPESEKLGDEACKTAVKQLEAGLKARAPRFAEIQKGEDQYAGVKTKALRGRNNVPFDAVIARGFVDTLMSKIDEGLQISYERAAGRQQDKKPAAKLTAAVDHLRGPDQGQWDLKDLGVKKLAIFSGRGIYKKYSARDEKKGFCDYLEAVDHWDFYTEPQGGGFLDQHLFKGQMNIFRSTEQLKSSKAYNQRQVAKLLRCTTADETKKNEEAFKYKMSRLAGMGIDFEANAFTGSQMHKVVEHVMYWRGKWYYMVFNYEHGIWLRFEELEKVFTVAKHYPGRGPWLSWATHFDPFVFWSLAPMDSIRPIAHAMKKTMNLSLDNLEKRNWGQRAYDPNVFNPRDLLWKHDGLVKANIRTGQEIEKHIVTFQTPDTTAITINMFEMMNNFLGENTGITSGAKGKSDQAKVGIYMGDMQQVADRLGLVNKMYEQCHVEIGVNAQWGLYDHMPESYAVKIIGNTGIEWNEELIRKDVDRKFAIRIIGSNSEEQMNAALGQRKQNSLMMIQRDPVLRQRVNPGWYLREVLMLGGYDAETVRVASDTQNDADDDLMSEAAQAIEDIIEGREPKVNRGATTGFVKKIVDFAYDTDIDMKMFKKLVAYAEKHIPIAQENMQRQVVKIQAAAAMASIGQPGNKTAPAGGGASGGAEMPPAARGSGEMTPGPSMGGAGY